MNPKHQALIVELILAINSRSPSQAQKNLLKLAETRWPNCLGKAKKLAPKVNKNVNAYMLDTWYETIKEDC